MKRVRYLIFVVLWCLGACSDGKQNGEDGGVDPQTRSWVTVQSELPGMVLSISGSGSRDVWIAGADSRDGQGPTVMHFDGAAWSRLDTGLDAGDLWWVFAPKSSEPVWLTGADGLILRHERGSGVFTRITTPATDATLYGIWGPPGGPHYAVGGAFSSTSSTAGPANLRVIYRIEGDVATEVAGLPATLDDDEVFFKVWGTSTDDVWVIGTMGSVLRFDGTEWGRTTLPDMPRLVTIHGSGVDDVVIVGGLANAVIFERVGQRPWEQTAPTALPGLNGVFVAPSGLALAAGTDGVVLERVGGAWTQLERPPLVLDWHAAWIEPDTEALYVGGGDFLSSDPLDEGALLRYELKEAAQ